VARRQPFHPLPKLGYDWIVLARAYRIVLARACLIDAWRRAG
jgi:hypothetical protein